MPHLPGETGYGPCTSSPGSKTSRERSLLGMIFAVILSPCAGAPLLILIETLLFTGSASALDDGSCVQGRDPDPVFRYRSGIGFAAQGTTSGTVQHPPAESNYGILLIVFGLWLLMAI